MELDETLPCSYFTNDFSINRDVQTIENGVESLALYNEADMLDDSDVCGDMSSMPTRNSFSLNTSENVHTEILNESTNAFQQFQWERKDTTFTRTCLFCKKHFTGNRYLLLDHFTEQHNFFMGQPDNLVYINEFLDILENMLNKLQCIYCEKIFKDWSALKEHMRKKMHKRINPDNKAFDKFYMSNYLNVFNTMELTNPDTCYEQKVNYSGQYKNSFLQEDEETEIEVEPKDNSIICLYCECKYSDFDDIMNHLKIVHEFDFRYLKKEYKLCFYSQVKLINYIRRKVLVNECTICDIPFTTKKILGKHMKVSGHIKLLPDRLKWDQSEYFFSTLDTDYLLCGLQDDDEEDHAHDSPVEIISEDIQLPKSSILTDENLRRLLL